MCNEHNLEKNILDFIDECMGKEHPERYLISVLHSF